MHSFRVRLILALIAGITLVSVASTYFEVLAHKHMLRTDLEHRTERLAASLAPEVELALTAPQATMLDSTVRALHGSSGTLGLAVYTPSGRLLASSGSPQMIAGLPAGSVQKAISHNATIAAFGHTQNQQWLEVAFPVRDGQTITGVLVLLEDANYIRTEGAAVWQRSFWRIVAFVVLIVGVTLLMVRWFLMAPMTRVARRLQSLRMGHPTESGDEGIADLGIFSPIAREVETMAQSLIKARASAEVEARLRNAGENLWTAERLAVHVRESFGDSRIFVVSNREPYMHVRQGRETKTVVPASGLVSAIEPILRACDGVWVAHGSGTEDANYVDAFDRLRVPPDDPRYTLRRVWLSSEEESGYYDGFANEGIWPLCHIAHTRPIFRASDWLAYQHVNEKFAAALLEEMEGTENPVVFIQDYHFALLPRLIRSVRPEARVAIFWHIPWPNPEAFGICPWQAELLDGLLGADLIGFHIPLHCHNFLSTVDRVLESRTDREHLTARRHGHLTLVRPYPISTAFEIPTQADLNRRVSSAFTHAEIQAEFGVRCDTIALGVDRLDYTKGIVERLMALEHLYEAHPMFRERLTMVQIAAPSRTRIPRYADLRREVEEAVTRINERYQTPQWRPIILVERQCSHDEVNRWYRTAEICLVTSLHDGMNLVAKEYLAARDDDDGVLILSKFTGAAIELADALIVNPYDIEGVAEAIRQGLEMNLNERTYRMQRMRRQVMEHNIYRWAATILGDLRELRMESITESPGPRLLDSGESSGTVINWPEGEISDPRIP